MRTLVYRVTSAAGVGMYMSVIKIVRDEAVKVKSLWAKAGLEADASSVHPRPDDDGICFGSEHFFGFKDVNQLKKWVHADIRHSMAKYKGQIRVFEVDDKHVSFGKKQLAFKKRHAKLIAIHDILAWG